MKKSPSLAQNAFLAGILVFILLLLPYGISSSLLFVNKLSVFASTDAFGGGNGSGSTGSIGGSGGGGTSGGSNGGGVSGGNSAGSMGSTATGDAGQRGLPGSAQGQTGPGSNSPGSTGSSNSGGSPSGGNSNTGSSGTSATEAASPEAAAAQQSFLKSIQTVYGATSPELSSAKQDISDFNRIERSYGPAAKQQLIEKLATYDQVKAKAIQTALSNFLAAAPGAAQDAAAPKVINAVLAAASPQDLRNIVAAFSTQPNDVTQAFMNSIAPENRVAVQEAAKEYFSQNPSVQQSLTSALQSTLAKLAIDGIPVDIKNLITNPTFANFIALVGTQVLNIPGTDPTSFNTKTLTITKADGTTYSVNIATADGGIIAAFATAGLSLPPGVGSLLGAAITQAVAEIGDATVSKILDAVPSTGALYDTSTATLVTSVNGEVTGNVPAGFNVAAFNVDIQNGTVKLVAGKISEANLSKYSGPGAGGPGKHSMIDDGRGDALALVGAAGGTSYGNNSPWSADGGKLRIFAVFQGKGTSPKKFVPKEMSGAFASTIALNNIGKVTATGGGGGAGASSAGNWYDKLFGYLGWRNGQGTSTSAGGRDDGYGAWGNNGTSSNDRNGEDDRGVCIKPRITSVAVATVKTGQSFQYKIVGSGSAPLSFGINAGSLPSGLSYSSSTQIISGLVASSSSYRGNDSSVKVPISVKNACGESGMKLELKIINQGNQNRGFLGALLYGLLNLWGLDR